MVKYAVSTDDLEKEMRALRACFDALRELNTAAQHRVVEWVRSWIIDERED